MRNFILGTAVLTAILGWPSLSQAQTLLNIKGKEHICSFAPNEVLEDELYSFASSDEARALVAEIMSTVGLVPRFTVFAANVPNAAAVIEGEERLIVYSEHWIQNTIADDRWAAISLMAHEIAHHLNGHTLEAGGSRPPTELEADSFAGFAVGRLGGSLRDAQSLFNQLPASGSDTHPPRSARLEAVAVGWRDGAAGRTSATPASVPSVGEQSEFDFILPQSSTRLLTVQDVLPLSAHQLRLARNEIFARKGRGFASPDLQAYFSRRSWYRPSVAEVTLTQIERENVAILQAEERRR